MNLGRNKKRTILVILSMALSLVLFNTIYTISIGFDMDKYLAKFVDTDFLIAHADYFNYQFRGKENSLTESMIEMVQSQPGFEEGGRLLGNPYDKELFTVEDPDSTLPNIDPIDNNNYCVVYGLEDLPLERLEILEGEIDAEKLKTGNYILEGVQLNDKDEPSWNTSHYEVGDKVVLHNFKGTNEKRIDNTYTTREFEVMAKVKVKTFTNSCGYSFDYSFYLPAQVYMEMTAEPGIMSYVYNVSDEEMQTMEVFLKDYTENVEPVMNYSSKNTKVVEFDGLRNMVLLVGGLLSFVIGLIGVLNFVNSMLTSILTRRREFAMLQSIGMTTKQLRKMLICEGLFYTGASGVFSLVLGVIMSVVTVRSFSQNMWFFSYQFTILPLVCIIPVLLVIGILLPGFVLKTVENQSIVERLRELEE